MADCPTPRKPKREETNKRNAPVAVTHEGFWCCPSNATFQKPTTLQKKHSSPSEKKKALPKSEFSPFDSEEVDTSRRKRTVEVEMAKKKVTVELGDAERRDFKVILHGRHGFVVDLHLQKSLLVEKSSFFAGKLREEEKNVVGVSFMHVHDCNDVETYVEIIRLMYRIEIKPVLIKHGVPKVLRLLKVAEQLGFRSCVQSCLEYLEAVPWGGQKEEESVVATLLELRVDLGGGVSPVLRRISADTSPPTEEMLSHILDLVLRSRDEQARGDMKLVLLKLLTESDISATTINTACEGCMKSLRLLLVEAAGDPAEEPKLRREQLGKLASLEADNLVWLLEMLVERVEGEGFVREWAGAEELAGLYGMVQATVRHHVSMVTARIFTCVGKGEVVVWEETRRMLVRTWLRPLMEDYRWVEYRQRRCERVVIEEGIGKTILTLPLEDQREAFLHWLGCFLKVGGGDEGCPNLEWAFRVWWRRAFGRPYANVF